VRVTLWLGAYQLLFQGGTSDYAAVDTTVELAKKHRSTAKAAGLVNAVLRGITRLKPTRTTPAPATLARNAFALDFETTVTVARDIFPTLATLDSHLAAARSHPAPYVHHLRKIYGDETTAAILLRNNLRPAVTLRVDADKIDIPTTAGLIPHAETKRFLVAADGWNPVIEHFVETGALSPQDPTSAKPVRQLSQYVADKKIAEPKSILDLCAGLGTKSLQLARAFPEARITATDIDQSKLARLRARAAQVNANNLLTLPIADVAKEQLFDIVLLDVPCSNTGVMAKRVQSRWRWPSLDHEALHTLQTSLLTQGVSLTAPKGIVVYATCSIDPAENETLIAAFIEKSERKISIVEQQSTLPSLTNAPAATFDGGHYTILSVE
jgi:16S rRNA (cytosine967-C5)-methyltransferase